MRQKKVKGVYLIFGNFKVLMSNKNKKLKGTHLTQKILMEISKEINLEPKCTVIKRIVTQLDSMLI